MLASLKNNVNAEGFFTWAILVIATCLAFEMHVFGLSGALVGLLILAIAYVKSRLVVLTFMEMRDAPFVWRAVVEGWLVGVTLIIAACYWYGAAWA